MIDSSEKRNRQLAFEVQNSHVREKRSDFVLMFYGGPQIYQFYHNCHVFTLFK